MTNHCRIIIEDVENVQPKTSRPSTAFTLYLTQAWRLKMLLVFTGNTLFCSEPCSYQNMCMQFWNKVDSTKNFSGHLEISGFSVSSCIMNCFIYSQPGLL